MIDAQVAHELRRCYRIAEAGEKGYATAAVNMPNLGIKILMKSLAEQRARFKGEILDLMASMGGDPGRPGRSLPAIIHRGRVAIFAAMIIEEEFREKVILKEVLVGENAAEGAYTRALSHGLPSAARELVERQLMEIRKARKLIHLLLGHAGSRMVVRLFHSDAEAEQAVQSLHAAGYAPSTAEKLSLEQAALYRGRGATVMETILSGAVGGGLWGGLTGVLVGIGVVQTTGPALAGFLPVFGTWLLVAIGFLLIGALVSSALAFFIGIGVSEDDSVQLRDSLERYHILLQTVVDQAHYIRIRQMINLEYPESI